MMEHGIKFEKKQSRAERYPIYFSMDPAPAFEEEKKD